MVTLQFNRGKTTDIHAKNIAATGRDLWICALRQTTNHTITSTYENKKNYDTVDTLEIDVQTRMPAEAMRCYYNATKKAGWNFYTSNERGPYRRFTDKETGEETGDLEMIKPDKYDAKTMDIYEVWLTFKRIKE